MGYISQDAKKVIAAQLKKIMPKGWKYSLAVRDYSELSLTIASAPVDLLALVNANSRSPTRGYAQLSNHGLTDKFKGNPEMVELFTAILAVLRGPDFVDNSDSMRDYSDVSHYIRVNLGRFDKAFAVATAYQVGNP